MNIILKGKENVYQQIINEYKKYIELNIIRKDEKLPSCRMLASELGINPNTVQKAYNVLEQEGYIKALPKKGVYVIYDFENKSDDKKAIDIELVETISKLKDKSVEYDELLNIINKVYGR